MASRTASPSAAARRRIATPWSEAMTLSIASRMVDAGVTSCRRSQGRTSTPAPRYLHRSSASQGWSLCIGHASTGFPWLRLSTVEFHPQWLMNAAVAPCARISSCGAHPVTTTPRADASLSSDAAAARRVLSTSASSRMSARSASRSTQTNRCLLSRSAAASSRTCSTRSDDVVPKDTYSTDASGCLSSQSRHSCRACLWAGVARGPMRASGPVSTGLSGPTANSLGPSEEGIPLSASRNSPSSARQVLTTTPAPGARRRSWPILFASATNSGVAQAAGGWKTRPWSRRMRWAGSAHPTLYDAARQCTPSHSALGSRAASAAAKAAMRSCSTTTRRWVAERPARSAASGARAPPSPQKASKRGCMWAGNGEVRSGDGEAHAGISSARKRTAARSASSQPWRRARASVRCGSGAAKCTGRPRDARRRDRWRNWFRWPCAGNGTVTTATVDSIAFGRDRRRGRGKTRRGQWGRAGIAFLVIFLTRRIRKLACPTKCNSD
ncbi:hypothetical protein PR202_gb21919 [Eleusine coracana subsp. coracana]|uniref:Uncharacterized protein n=1 Tax=Eleusine coracana subsp. coracana TaxID=191504 RepID=A0AAV5FGE1_ELECO|nr:hypothetical protein PR202_gb21919 [Eleusine coracana subsp. coracana]